MILEQNIINIFQKKIMILTAHHYAVIILNNFNVTINTFA